MSFEDFTRQYKNTQTFSANVLRSHELTTSDDKFSPHSTIRLHTQNENALFHQKILNFFGSHSNSPYKTHMNFLTHGYIPAFNTTSISTKTSQTQDDAIHSKGSLSNEHSIIHFSQAETSATSFSALHEVSQTLLTYCFLISSFRSLLAT